MKKYSENWVAFKEFNYPKYEIEVFNETKDKIGLFLYTYIDRFEKYVVEQWNILSDIWGYRRRKTSNQACDI